MKLPGDTRQLRDIKLREFPSWLMKRNWTPLGLWFSLKRCMHMFLMLLSTIDFIAFNNDGVTYSDVE